MIPKERTVIKTTLKTFQSSFVLLRRSRCFSTNTSSLQGRTAPNAKRFGIVSYTYRFSVGMRTIQKDKGSRKNTSSFCGKRSRNGEYRQQQKRLTKSKVCGNEVSYTFLEKVAKTESTEVMNYVVFSMPHGEI